MSIWDYKTKTTDKADEQGVYPRTPWTDPEITCMFCRKAMHATIEELNECLKNLKR